MPKSKAPRLGIALGSGSARGWAHIGVLRALEEIGIVPEIVCGTSIGALVGAAYAGNRLDALQEWVLDLDWWNILSFMEPRSSGLIEGERLMKAFYERVEDVPIESLPKRFGAVATDLLSGQEIWFQEGPLGKAVRASIALPGLFSPIHQDGRWLVDGGLVNPVPVSLCRALGADRVIAVNLNAGIHNRQFLRRGLRARTGDFLEQLGSRLQAVLGGGEGAASAQDQDQEDGVLTLFDVMTGALNIMQDRITRSRLAGDPPDVVLAPRLNHLALMDFDRAEQAIAEGRACVNRYQPVLKDALD